AHPKGLGLRRFSKSITAGICSRWNGYRSNCAAKILNFACPVGVMCGRRSGKNFLTDEHSHMLRHACGFKLANDGHDSRAIQAYLGHRSIMSTVRYTALTPN